MDHDQLFKELISTFFGEFVDLLLPDVARYLDRGAGFAALDKEIFTDVNTGDRREADLVVKAKVKDSDAFFLIHVEHQASRQSSFAQRMFGYCAHLMERYSLPVYPVAILTYDKPRTVEPASYKVTIAGKTIIQFEFTAIQLNQIPWRRFAQVRNPVACALMAKLDIPQSDRVRVKLECLRLLATLRLDPARTSLIGGFIDSYLELSARETALLTQELIELPGAEREATMEIVTSWEQRGIEKGIEQGILQGIEQGKAQGIERVVLRLIRKRFGTLPDALGSAVGHLSSDQLDSLAVDLLDFASAADLEAWLARQPQAAPSQPA